MLAKVRGERNAPRTCAPSGVRPRAELLDQSTRRTFRIELLVERPLYTPPRLSSRSPPFRSTRTTNLNYLAYRQVGAWTGRRARELVSKVPSLGREPPRLRGCRRKSADVLMRCFIPSRQSPNVPSIVSRTRERKSGAAPEGSSETSSRVELYREHGQAVVLAA